MKFSFTLLHIHILFTRLIYTSLYQLSEYVHSPSRVNLDHHNAFIQSFHISTCKKQEY